MESLLSLMEGTNSIFFAQPRLTLINQAIGHLFPGYAHIQQEPDCFVPHMGHESGIMVGKAAFQIVAAFFQYTYLLFGPALAKLIFHLLKFSAEAALDLRDELFQA